MRTLTEITIPRIRFRRYRHLTPAIYLRTRFWAKKMRNISILHINSTAQGGGVAELLRSQVPLERDLGLNSSWFVISPPARFFPITKKIHNLLQGHAQENLSRKEKEYYLEILQGMRNDFQRLLKLKSPDIIIIHDPQPLPFIRFIPPEYPALLRLHIDISTPDKTTLEFFRPLILKYRAVVLTSSLYRPLWLSKNKTKIIMPAIDPFTPKNRTTPTKKAKRILESFSINTDKPIITQISRFDPWKDPLGVIRAYQLAKNKIPDLQLVLAGSFASDDPEGKEIFKKVKKKAKKDPHIFLWTQENPLFVNALQTASTLVIQKSLREGFGLTMTEAMWKGTPVIAGMTEGARMQIVNGKNGVLVSSPEETARAVIRLYRNKALAARLGRAARETVKKKFLFSRFLLENLETYASVLLTRTISSLAQRKTFLKKARSHGEAAGGYPKHQK